MNNNQKPISIMIDDFKQSLMNCVSSAGLPPAIIEPIVKDIYQQIIEISKQELERDVIEYQKAQQEKERQE